MPLFELEDLIYLIFVGGCLGLICLIIGIVRALDFKWDLFNTIFLAIGLTLIAIFILSVSVFGIERHTYTEDKYDLSKISEDVPVRMYAVPYPDSVMEYPRIEYCRVGGLEEYIYYVTPTPTPVVIDHPEWLKEET